MKIALIGDPHYANHKLFGRPTDRPGVNTRLLAISKVIRWIAEDLDANHPDIRKVFFLGDITHHHGVLTPPVYTVCIDDLYYFLTREKECDLLVGNHDMDMNGRNILGAFRASVGEFDEYRSVHPISSPQVIEDHDGMKVYAIPYCSYEETINALGTMANLDKAGIVFMHKSFDGATLNDGYVFDGGLCKKDIPECVVKVVSGHIHKPQVLYGGLVEYLGTPLQHTFGAVGDESCYGILDTETGEVERHPIPVGPRFHILPHNLQLDDLPGVPEEDYYRIDVPTDVDLSEIKELREAVTNVITKPIPIDAETRSRVEEHLEKEGENVDFVDIMKVYTAMNTEDEERADRLFALGQDIMRSI